MKRYELWDNLKAILIICVVVGHFADRMAAGNPSFRELRLFIYPFHMPLFIFISGLFHSNKNLLRRTIFLISIGYVWKVTRTVSVMLLYGQYHFSLLSEGGVPWFMYALAAFGVLTWILRKQNLKWILFLGILVACFAGYDRSIGDFLCISRIVIFYPCYLAGVLLNSDDIIDLKKKTGVWGMLTGATVLIIWAALAVTHYDQISVILHLLTGRNPFKETIYAIGPFYRLLCYALTMITSTAIILLVPDRRIKGFTRIGTNTLNVYFWHYLCLEVLVCLCGWGILVSFGPIGKSVYLLGAATLAVLLGEFKLFDFPCKNIKNICYSHPSE